MAAGSPGSARFRRTRSVSLSGDAEYVRLSSNASKQVYVGRKSSDYCGSRERWAASRPSSQFSRTFSSNCIDRYRGVVGAAGGDRNGVPKFGLYETDGVLDFNCLPDDCREHIFSFLTISERGIAAQVCLVLPTSVALNCVLIFQGVIAVFWLITANIILTVHSFFSCNS